MDFSGCQWRPPNRPEPVAIHFPQHCPLPSNTTPPKKSLSPNHQTHTSNHHGYPSPPPTPTSSSPLFPLSLIPEQPCIWTKLDVTAGEAQGGVRKACWGALQAVGGADRLKRGDEEVATQAVLEHHVTRPHGQGWACPLSPSPWISGALQMETTGHPTPPRVKHLSPYLSLISVFLRWDPGNRTIPDWEGVSHVGQKG